MTKYSFATLDQWVRKTQRRADAVVKQATNDLLDGIEIVPGIARGGTPQRGTIPRDLGALAGSKRSTLYGATAMSGTGEDSHLLIIGRMSAGDRAVFTWGGAAAPYVLPIHYGSGSYPGTFFRDEAAKQWRGYVAAATARAKVLIP